MGTWHSKHMLFFYSKWNMIRHNMVSALQVCVLFSQSRQPADYWSESRALLPRCDSGPPVPKHWKIKEQEQLVFILRHTFLHLFYVIACCLSLWTQLSVHRWEAVEESCYCCRTSEIRETLLSCIYIILANAQWCRCCVVSEYFLSGLVPSVFIQP